MSARKVYEWITISGKTSQKFIGTNISIERSGQTIIYKEEILVAVIPKRAFIIRGKEVQEETV
jgi:hypothetical protein